MNEEYSINSKGVLFSHRYDEGYFSDLDGYEESNYVFLEANKIKERCQEKDNFVIGELGFGTGLNFLVTWEKFLDTNKAGVLYFITCEKYLLDKELIKKSLNRFSINKTLLTELLSKLPKQKQGFHLLNLSEGKVKLLLLLGDAQEKLKELQGKVDVWYLDGFSPKKNPDIWNESIFNSLARLSKDTTTYSSFTASSLVRNNLKKAGFSVERVKGFGYKKHMIKGEYNGYVKPKLSTYPYYFFPTEPISNPKIAIIGGGLAGTSLARVLSSFNCQIFMYEKGNALAFEASGNDRAMAVPIISKKEDLYAEFTLAGLTCLLSRIEKDFPIRKEILEFTTNNFRKSRLQEGSRRYDTDFIEYHEASDYNEFQQNYDFIEHKSAISLSPKDLCIYNINKSKAKVLLNSPVVDITKKGEKWLICSNGKQEQYDIVILANANAVRNFSYTQNLPLRPVRGQLIHLQQKDLKHSIKKVLNFMDYLIPYEKGYLLGATFDVDNTDIDFFDEDSQELLKKLHQAFPNLVESHCFAQKYKGRVGVRAVTSDYFPLVGLVADYDYYQQAYSNLHYGRPHNHYPVAQYHKNLYVASGYGARGLLSSFLSAELIASQIFDLPLPLPEKQLRMLHTGRFWIRDLKRKQTSV